jgi:hypothetical protein
MKKVNCYKCRHYVVTWEPKHPKACRFFGFKTNKMPSATVFESTGKICEAFESKQINAKKKPPPPDSDFYK